MIAAIRSKNMKSEMQVRNALFEVITDIGSIVNIYLATKVLFFLASDSLFSQMNASDSDNQNFT